MKVFVYGNFRKGCLYHYLLRGAKPAAYGIFKGSMYAGKDFCGGRPAVTEEHGKGGKIFGEVYDIDREILSSLDFYAPHPGFFRREEKEIILNNGGHIRAWIYLADREKINWGTAVSGGDWVLHECVESRADWYFAYGPDMDLYLMKERYIHFVFRGRACLNDFNLVFNKTVAGLPGMGHAGITPLEGSIVEGALYALMPGQLSILDKYMCAPSNYTRQALDVTDGWGRKIRAHAYIPVKDKIMEGLLPSKEYLLSLKKGEDIMSAGYYEKLKKTECIALSGSPAHFVPSSLNVLFDPESDEYKKIPVVEKIAAFINYTANSSFSFSDLIDEYMRCGLYTNGSGKQESFICGLLRILGFLKKKIEKREFPVWEIIETVDRLTEKNFPGIRLLSVSFDDNALKTNYPKLNNIAPSDKALKTKMQIVKFEFYYHSLIIEGLRDVITDLFDKYLELLIKTEEDR